MVVVVLYSKMLCGLSVWLFTVHRRQIVCFTRESAVYSLNTYGFTCVYIRDVAKEPKEKKKGSASIWCIYASLPLR